MDQKQEQPGKADNLCRRKFMRNGATTAAGLAAGLGAAGRERMQFGKAGKPRNYNPDME